MMALKSKIILPTEDEIDKRLQEIRLEREEFPNETILPEYEINGVKVPIFLLKECLEGNIGEESLIKAIETENFSTYSDLMCVHLCGDDLDYEEESCKLEDKYVYGLLVGYNKDNQTYKIEGISENDDIEINSYVTTTGLGNNFPSGILIGKVSGVTTDSFDLTKIVEVKSDVDFNDLVYVRVLKRNDLW